MKLVKFIK